MSIDLFHLKKVNIEMPVFVYSIGLDKCIKGMLHIEGKYSNIFRTKEFKGFIEICGERYDIKSFCDDTIICKNPVLVLAGVINETKSLKKGLTAYVHKNFNFIKGTLYQYDGKTTTMDFAAPASTIHEAEQIENLLEPKCFDISIITCCNSHE